MATCSIRARVELSSLNTAPLALMTKTLFLYMRMYGAALLSARTATEGSGRLMIIHILQSFSGSGEHAVQNGHLHRQAIEGFAPYHGARAVQDLIGDGDIAAHRQAVHELGIGHGSRKPAFPDAPIPKLRTQPRIALEIPVTPAGAPFLGIQHTRATERGRAIGGLGH